MNSGASFKLVPMPSSATPLCFDKEEFMKDSFDVDAFVADCRRRVQLETLREDLHIYFKSLKNAMVELINKDYADFVNLSSNLVGMDKVISNLSIPLGQFKEEVLSVKMAMDDAIHAVEEKMVARTRIREKKATLQRLINITKSVEKMESILKIAGSAGTEDEEEGDEESIELSGQQIERVASEFNQLQYYVTQSKGLPLVEKIRPRIAAITVTLQHSLEKSFQEGLETGQTDILKQCLRTYATIDKMRDVEALFRKIAVKPYMEEVIQEKCLQHHPQGLKGLYARVLDFIPKHCRLIREVTSPTPGSSSQDVVRGYDFLVNAVWPEIANSLETRITSIFAAGNPVTFHEKYVSTMQFVERFELQCGSQASVKRLRAHPSFNTFMTKWSLPVYFQLRFQDIAGLLETALITPFNIEEEDNSGLRLNALHTLWQCIQRCWQQDVYLAPLCHRFWKLTLQLLSRGAVWIDDVYIKEIASDKNEPDPSMSETTKMGATAAAAAESSSTATDTTKTTTSAAGAPATNPPPVTSDQIIRLVADVDHLCSKLPDLFDGVITPRLVAINCKCVDVLSVAFQESTEDLSKRQEAFGEFITRGVCSQCAVHLKSANDIPRLYRRTNKELPNKPSAYVSNTLKPLQLFVEDHRGTLTEERRRLWLISILTNICKGYLIISTELLSSVKKMEDSLKRLKALRKTDAAAATTQQGTSDDDKIRLQLALDVRFFGEQIQSMGVSSDNIQPYQELLELVSSTVNQILS
ncbi:conserved oligomeric Golgi complex subunit 2-like [Asterias amurensis]|uniref:conserved oligomeric Golgi complex subunit 2-like n=1 Tax=Asterias amurensis TaxID=7602 RepID=UPI003AB364E4